MTHASLCTGIGGFDLAAEWCGWTNLFNAEVDAFCKEVLKHHFPNTIQYDDITTTDFKPWGGRVDVLSAGFPCQPYSNAGQRKGTADPRHLWGSVLRAIQEISPRWFVGENVYGITNWADGLVFENICADLENEGYEVTSYIIPACGVGAYHRRYRVFFVAYSERIGLSTPTILGGAEPKKQIPTKRTMSTLETIKSHDFGSESNKHGIVDGIPVGLDECSLHAYGNGIVPQIAHRIFDTIQTYENNQ